MSRIKVNLINRRTGAVLEEAGVRGPLSNLSDLQRRVTQPFSSGKIASSSIPTPAVITYNTDLTAFTDVFSMDVELAPDETFDVKSHDFVEFIVEVPNPAPGVDKNHQIGVGFLEQMQRKTSKDAVRIMANGRDLFGQFMFAPFSTPIRQELTLINFMQQVIRGSYLQKYMDLRQKGKTKIRNLGAFTVPMFFRSDLEQKKGAMVEEYAELAINLVYMNRLGQAEIYGRTGNVGASAAARSPKSIGVLAKGSNVDDMLTIQNFTQVMSEITIFWTSAQAEQERNTMPSSTFKNTDPRVKHIDKPGFRTFNTSDLVSLGGNVNAEARIRDVGKSLLRKSMRSINQVVVMVSDPYFTFANGTQQPWVVGQKWTLQSTEPEFITASAPNGTDRTEMILAGINYQQNADGQQFQLKFIEEVTVV